MALKVNAALEEGPLDEERAYRALMIAVVSGRASSLPSDYLGIWEISFLRIGKGLAPLRGSPEGLYQTRGSH